MMEFLIEVSLWHWIILGVLLATAEALGVGGFLLGAAVAAFITSVLSWIGFSWQIQFIAFGIMALVFSIAYWKYFRSFNMYQEKNVTLNDKLETMKNSKGVVISISDESTGKVKIGDTLWEFSSSDKCSEGDVVVVIDYQGMKLIVKK